MPFRYVSVNAPVKNRAQDEAATIAILDELPLEYGPSWLIRTRLRMQSGTGHSVAVCGADVHARARTALLSGLAVTSTPM
jgi:hypothetical protein